MKVMLRSRERLEARCELLKHQTGNRPIALATIRNHQLVEAAVTKLLWSRDRAERETVRQLRLALRELRQEEEELQPRRKKPAPTWLGEVPSRRNQGTGFETESPAKRERPAFWACAADVPIDATSGSAQSRVNPWRRRLAPTEEDTFMIPTGRRR